MKIYIVVFDNGCEQQDNEMYTCAIYDSYDKAVKFCKDKGYEETGTKDLFKKKWEYGWGSYYYLNIEEFDMNMQFLEIE